MVLPSMYQPLRVASIANRIATATEHELKLDSSTQLLVLSNDIA